MAFSGNLEDVIATLTRLIAEHGDAVTVAEMIMWGRL